MALSRRRVWLIALAGVLAVVAAIVLVWFQPQKLFIDKTVDEALPTVVPTTVSPPSDTDATSTPTTPDPAPADIELRSGSFISRDHSTSGAVRVVELADGRRFVRLEALSTDNGPDLFLYLSTNSADGPEGAFDDEFVNLGRLKGNKGNQNYEVPADLVIDDWTSVVIWCDRFNSAFGAADLEAA